MSLRIVRVVPTTVSVHVTPEEVIPMAEVPAVVAGVISDAKGGALAGLRAVLTEENTDKIIAKLEEAIKARLPWYAKWIPLGVILDKMFPEILLKVFEDVLGA